MADMLPATEMISAMITPALLILGSSSLVSTSLVRLGRIVDRARSLVLMDAKDREKYGVDERTLHVWTENYKRRARLVEKSVTFFFAAVALFVSACLSIAIDRVFHGTLWLLPVGLVVLGMGCLLGGADLMVFECRLASRQLHEEIP